MDHQDRSAELEKEAEGMEERQRELGEDIQSSKKEWESKVSDESIPGAQEPPIEEQEAEESDAGDTATPGAETEGEGEGEADAPDREANEPEG